DGVEWATAGKDRGDVGAELPQRGRYLGADEAHPDDDDFPRRAFAYGVCIGLGSERVHTVEVDAGQVRPAGTRARRDEHPVDDDPLHLPDAFHRLENSGMFAPLIASNSPSRSWTMRRPTSSGCKPGFRCGAARRSISVSTAPGLRHTALIPCSRPSTAMASVRPMTPYFETLYADSPGNFSVA